jgi:hypothetical protein
MRDQRDVQFAHDLIHAIITDGVMLELSPAENLIHHAVHDVLSWVLCGECGAVFEQNLAMLKAEVLRRGYLPVLKQ